MARTFSLWAGLALAAATAAQADRAWAQDRGDLCRDAPASGASAAGADPQPRWGGVVSFVLENDAIVGPDRDYTNGVGVIVSLPPRETRPDANIVDRVHCAIDDRFFSLAFGGGAHATRTRQRASWRLAQQLYTPQDLLAPVADPNDRPYAAWDYVSYAQVRDQDVVFDRGGGDLTWRALSTAQIDFGIVGPSAGGEWIQRGVHKLIDAEVDPQGWDSQLPDEPAFALRYERKLVTRCENCRGSPFDVEWEEHAGFALGTLDASASVGVGGRIGINIGRDYGPPRLRPSLDGSSHFESDARFGGYVFAGAAARAVGRDMFLDGTLFSDSPSVRKKYLVGDAQVGIVALTGPVKISLSHVLRSEEFNGQDRDTQFDALGISVRF